MNIGDNISRLRKLKKLTQEDLAQLVGVSKNTIWNYENNKRKVDHDLLLKISNILEVDISDLLGMEETERMKFESDFNLEDFDPYILKIFNEFKEDFNNKASIDDLNNSKFMQNMVIDYLARYKAEVKTYGSKFFDEFIIVNGKLHTGKEQFDILFNKYYPKYIDEYKEMSLDRLHRILKSEVEGSYSGGFIRLINDHAEKFGEISLPFYLRIIYTDYKNNLTTTSLNK